MFNHNIIIALRITWRLLVFKHPGFAHKLFVGICSKCTNLLVAYGIVWNERICNLPAIADRIKIEFSLWAAMVFICLYNFSVATRLLNWDKYCERFWDNQKEYIDDRFWIWFKSCLIEGVNLMWIYQRSSV